MRPAIFIFIASFFVALDQLSKWAVTQIMIKPLLSLPATGFFEWISATEARLPYAEINVWPFFNIVMVWNQGVSFGLFNQSTDYGPVILVILALVISAVFLIWLFRSNSDLQRLGIAMVIGGALGNVIDRARFGAVIDFLDVHAAGYHWPAFNVADSFVVVGVGILIVYALFFEKNLQKAP